MGKSSQISPFPCFDSLQKKNMDLTTGLYPYENRSQAGRYDMKKNLATISRTVYVLVEDLF